MIELRKKVPVVGGQHQGVEASPEARSWGAETEGCIRAFFTTDYFTLWPSPLTFDLEQLQCVVGDVMKLYQIWTQSSSPRRNYCDLNIWPDDLERRVTCCARLSDNNCHQVWLLTTYPCLNYSVFDANTLCHAVILTFYSASGVMCKKCERNRLISTAEILIMI